MSAHEVLGVPRDASPAVIRKAYLKLALTSHPDKGGSVEVGGPVSSVVSEAPPAGVPPRPGGLRVAARRQSERARDAAAGRDAARRS